MNLTNATKAACQLVGDSEAVTDEILSDALAAVWDDDSMPPAAQAWIVEVIRRKLATKKRQVRRNNARRTPLEAIEAGKQKTVGRFVHRRDPVVDAAVAKELRTVIARDDFEREAVAALLGEHSDYENFAEFARRQTYFSKAKAYKRREPIRQRLRELQKLEGLRPMSGDDGVQEERGAEHSHSFGRQLP